MTIIFEDMAPDDAAVYLPNTDLPIIFWRNVIGPIQSQVTATTQHPDFPISNVLNASLGLKWKEDKTGSPVQIPVTIQIDMASSLALGPVNYVAIAGHNFGSLNCHLALDIFSGQGVGSPLHQDSPPLTQVIDDFEVEDDGPIILMFAEIENTHIHFRIHNFSSQAAEFAVLYVGKATVLPEGIQADHTPLPIARRNKVVLGQSENGSFLGRIVLGDWAESTATIANLTKDWVRSELLDFLEFAAEFPFFYAWSPLTYPEETAMAWLDNDPLPVFDIDGYASVDLAMKGIPGAQGSVTV